MNENQRASERGQVLVLIALGMVALLGFTALAIDGSMMYSDRRYGQSAADTSSLAGGGELAQLLDAEEIYYKDWDCAEVEALFNDVYAASSERAEDNGFVVDETPDADYGDRHVVTATCENIPKVGPDEKYVDIRVRLTFETKTSFVHFVYKGAVTQTVEAVTRVRPRKNVAFGYAIVALDENCDDGVEYNGGVDLYVTGGGIYSNSCMVSNGGSNVQVAPPHEINCTEYNGVLDCSTINGGGSISPVPGGVDEPIPSDEWEVPPPDCTGLPNRTVPNHVPADQKPYHLQPGIYSGLTMQGADDFFLEPGLYCFDGAFTMNGGNLYGYGVTIYMRGSGSSDDFAASGGIAQLWAPPTGGACDAAICPPALPGVLIYASQVDVAITGNNESHWEGMIYAPNGLISASGTGDLSNEINCQLIGRTVTIEGNVTIDITFNDMEAIVLPIKLDLYR